MYPTILRQGFVQCALQGSGKPALSIERRESRNGFESTLPIAVEQSYRHGIAAEMLLQCIDQMNECRFLVWCCRNRRGQLQHCTSGVQVRASVNSSSDRYSFGCLDCLSTPSPCLVARAEVERPT